MCKFSGTNYVLPFEPASHWVVPNDLLEILC